MSKYVVEGTDVDSLRKGPGHYPRRRCPGEPGTTAIAGHRTTYGAPFRHIDERAARRARHHRHARRALRLPGPGSRRSWTTRTCPCSTRSATSGSSCSACHPLYSAAQRDHRVRAASCGASRRGSRRAEPEPQDARVDSTDESRDSRNRISRHHQGERYQPPPRASRGPSARIAPRRGSRRPDRRRRGTSTAA